MRYLVTGGAGFIGSHLADALLGQGHQVVVLDDFSTGSGENLAHLVGDKRLEVVEGSVTDADLVDALMATADRCVHLAAAVGVQLIVERPLDALLGNVRGCDTVLAAAARHGVRLLYASTSEVYGKNTDGALNEESDLRLGSPFKARWSYAIAKCFGEALAHGYHRDLGAEIVVVRLFNTVGPRQSGAYGMVLPRLVRQALAGDDLTVFGTGEQTRCFIHVLDTVRALTMLCDEPRATGSVFNIGNPVPVSIAELAARVVQRTKSSSAIGFVPYAEAYAPGFEELGRRHPDVRLLMGLVDWRPARTLDDAIDDVVAYERAAAAELAADVA